MSHTTTAKLSRAKISIAIVGGTGNLGETITTILLSRGWKPFFSRIILLTRDPDSPVSRKLEGQGAQLLKVDTGDKDTATAQEGLASVFNANQVDVVVNVLGLSISGRAFSDEVMRAAVSELSGVRVYFPSEFGVDHRLNDFGDFEHQYWNYKKAHVNEARRIAAGKVQVISVYPGLFLDSSIGPHFGFDIKSQKISPIGPPSQRISFTSKADIARSIAQLALLASNPTTNSQVPDDVYIAGCTRSFEEIATSTESTIEPSENLEEARVKVKDLMKSTPSAPPAQHIRILMGEGKLDFSSDNANELVNPRESCWKWKTVEEQVQESGGGTK